MIGLGSDKNNVFKHRKWGSSGVMLTKCLFLIRFYPDQYFQADNRLVVPPGVTLHACLRPLLYSACSQYFTDTSLSLKKILYKYLILWIHFTKISFTEREKKRRKNCECCPAHYLIVNHYSSMSWFKFRNLSVIVNCCFFFIEVFPYWAVLDS